MQIYLSIILISIIFISGTYTAQAIPPPDFIFNIGSQIVQVFAFLALGFSALLGILKKFFQSNPFIVRHKKLFWTLAALVVIILSFTGARIYESYKQNKAYSDWVKQSKNQNSGKTLEQQLEDPKDNLDQLQIGEIKPSVSPRGQQPADAGENFIQTYYKNLGNKNTAAAYEVSSKIVSYEIYKGWYENTTAVSVDNIQKISENNYSLSLSLWEGNNLTRYAVLTKLKQDATGKYSIERSDVRVLAQSGETQSPIIDATKGADFYEQNKNLELSISNEEFKTKIAPGNNAFVLDAREDEEYEVGYFAGSRHIRYADLKAGEWIKLPQDQVIYVLCWSGIRGKEVAEFLRTKQLVARYLENGADGWVDYGGQWVGGIKFLSKYTAERYQIVFSTQDVKNFVQQGVVLVDSRNPAKYQKNHINGSISVSVIYTPTSRLPETLAQVPAYSKIITICDDFVSCFDAKITGVKLEKLGHTFLGRYNKPWEY